VNPQYKDALLSLRYPVRLLRRLTYDHSPAYKDHGITALRCYRITLRFFKPYWLPTKTFCDVRYHHIQLLIFISYTILTATAHVICFVNTQQYLLDTRTIVTDTTLYYK